jgi:hypothetical protein
MPPAAAGEEFQGVRQVAAGQVSQRLLARGPAHVEAYQAGYRTESQADAGSRVASPEQTQLVLARQALLVRLPVTQWFLAGPAALLLVCSADSLVIRRTQGQG